MRLAALDIANTVLFAAVVLFVANVVSRERGGRFNSRSTYVLAGRSHVTALYVTWW